MVALSEAGRVEVWRDGMQRHANQRTAADDSSKTDFRAAVDAADDWWDSPSGWVAFNQALPQPYRANAGKRQKMRLLIRILRERLQEGI